MGVITGATGAVDGANTVGQWSVSAEADLQSIVASNTKSAELLLPGNLDWSGSYKSWGHTPYKMPNDTLAFKGSIDGIKGAAGDVMISGVEITWDLKSGAPIEHVVNFEGNGALTLGASVAADATVPNPPPSVGTKLEFPALIALLQDMKLSISAALQTYIDNGVIKRVAGNISAEMSYATLFDDPAILPARNSFAIAKMYVDATDYWELKWMVVGAVTDFTCDISAKPAIGATINTQFSGYNAGVEGYIKKPGAVIWWPV